MSKPFVVDHVNTSLEGFLDKSLSKSELQIRWVIESVCRKHPWCFYSNRELAEQFNLHPMTVSATVRSLVKKGAVLSEIEVRSTGTCRRMKLNPEYLKSKNHLVVEYNGKMTKRRIKEEEQPTESTPGGKSGGLPPLSLEAYPPRRKSNHFQELAKPAYNNAIYNEYFLSGNTAPEKGAGGEQEMSICQSRAMDRIVAHWKSKKPSLKVSGQRVTGRALPVLKALLSKHGEKTILETINLYHESLHNPTLICSKFNKRPAYRVSIEEFFAGFSIDNQIFIKQNKIKCLEGVDGWFQMCLKGAEEIERRFALVVADRFPVVTKLLREVISSWDGHPSLVGNRAESNLRKSAARLVEFHQRVKSRLVTGRTEMRLSTPAFLREYFVPYVLENLNLDRFRIYWLMSERFMDDFEQHLVDMRALAPPKERRVGGRRITRRLNPDEEDLRGVGSRGNWIGGRAKQEVDRVEPEPCPEDYLDAADYCD